MISKHLRVKIAQTYTDKQFLMEMRVVIKNLPSNVNSDYEVIKTR